MLPRCILTISFLLSTTSALGGHVSVTCSYFDTHNSFFTYPVSQGLAPQIIVSTPERAVYYKDYTAKVSIASAVDLKRVKLDSIHEWRCNDDASNAEYCNLIPDLNLKPDPNAYANLDDMISQNGNEFPVFQAELSPNADGLRTWTYNISTSGVYCTTIQLFGDNLQNSLRYNVVSINEQHFRGSLNHFTFDELVLEFYSWLAQVVLIIVFGSYTLKKVSKHKSNDAVSLLNSVYQTSVIQFKILIFLVGSTIYYLVNYLDLRYINKYGKSLLATGIDYIQTFITIVFSTWAIYNFLLLSSGTFWAHDTYNKLENRILKRNLAAAYGILAFLFKPNFAILLLIWLGGFWIRDRYKRFKNKILKTTLVAAYILICLVVFFHSALVEINYIIGGKSDGIGRRRPYLISFTSRVFTFVVCAFIAFIWRNVQVINSTVQIDGSEDDVGIV